MKSFAIRLEKNGTITVPQLSDQITTIREEANVTLNDLLQGLDDERQKIYQEKYQNENE